MGTSIKKDFKTPTGLGCPNDVASISQLFVSFADSALKLIESVLSFHMYSLLRWLDLFPLRLVFFCRRRC